MKNIFQLLKTDIRNIVTNRAAIVVIVAVMILPSMYAWFNIIPSWDPYSNTEGIAVAIVNEDEGTVVEGKEVNVGNEVVLSLMDNKKMGWEFVDKKEAKKGVRHGDYYASIMIPKDFSEKLTSILSDNPEKPVIDYYINEKINAIAPKVTTAGASGIVENIQSGFVKITSEAVFNAFNDVGIELEANQYSIERMRDSLYRLEDDLPEIERMLGVAHTDLGKVDQAVGRANEGMKKAKEITKEAEGLSDKIDGLLRTSDQAVHKYVPLVRQDLLLAQKLLKQVPEAADRLQERGESVDSLLNQIDESTKQIDRTNERLQNLADLIQDTNNTLTQDRPIEKITENLAAEKQRLEELKNQVNDVIATLKSGEHIAADVATSLQESAEQAHDQMQAIIMLYETSIIPEVQSQLDWLEQQQLPMRTALQKIQEANEQALKQVEGWQQEGLVSPEKQREQLVAANERLESNKTQLLTFITELEQLNELAPTPVLEPIIAANKATVTKIEETQQTIQRSIAKIDAGEALEITVWDPIIDSLTTTNHQLIDASKQYDERMNQLFTDIRKNLQTINKNLQEQLKQLEKLAADFLNTANKIQETIKNPTRLIAVLEDFNKRLTSAQDSLTAIEQITKEIQQTFDEGILLTGIDRISELQKDLTAFKSAILRSTKDARVSKKQLAEHLKNVKTTAASIDQSITDFTRFLDNELLPKYEAASNKANKALREGNRMLAKANATFPRVYDLLSEAEKGVQFGKEGLQKSDEYFPEIKKKVYDLASKVRSLEEKGDLAQLINLLKNDPLAEGDFFSEPVVLDQHELFPIPNYGSAMSPFFTALSLWVGALILVSTLIPDVPNKHRYKSYEAYFGRLLLFCMIGLVQAFIVTMGDMFLLKTFVAHKFWFVVFGCIVSMAFVVIVYTLVSVFGNTGKVMAIVLLVMQLGASGGTFPIQMTPEFFQRIHNFLPFTHGLNLLREAVGGIIWPIALKHIAWLVGYMLLFFFIGIRLKEKINKSSDKFVEKARESKLIL